MRDLYFDDKFAKLYEKIEGGSAETFRFQCEYGEAVHHFIKRKIPMPVGGKIYYDLITPYGYGGPLVVSGVPGKRKELCREFGDAFGRYCENNDIVSEFVRFHPIAKNAEDFADVYHPIFDRKTLATDLKRFADPAREEFSENCRRHIKQAMKKGVTYRITEKPKDLSVFIPIYYSTMDRVGASAFYYFGVDYFTNLIESFRDEIILIEAIFNEKTIAADLFFTSGGIVHYHLGGTLNEYLYLSPAYVMRYAAVLWGKEHGYSFVFYGGGTSTAEDNSLYMFKKHFAKNTEFDFYIGKKIWNCEIYTRLVEATGTQNSKFFPAYRDK